MVESYPLPGGMVQTDSWWRYDPSMIKLTSYFSLCGQWSPFISGQLLGKFLCVIMKLSSSNTMRITSKTKSRQRVSQPRISRHSYVNVWWDLEHLTWIEVWPYLQGGQDLQGSPDINGPLNRYVKLWVAHAPGMPGTFSPAADFKGNC